MKAVSLLELAKLLDVELRGDPAHLIHGINALDEATQDELSFLANDRYTEAMKKSKAGAICVNLTTPLSEGKNYLLCTNPSLSFQRVAETMFAPFLGSGFKQIHPTAVIHESVKIGPNVTIGPFVSIDQGARIAEGTTISSHVSIGYDVEIGKDCFIHPNCTLRERVRLGNRVILQPGAVIGSCGFGYIQDSLGRHIKIEQLGIVILEDDVEIGANTTIDRSRFKATIIRKGTKIDNLCQIAHNVEIGDHTIIAAQAGIAGSTKIGKHVVLGGQVGIVGHVELEDRVMVGSQGGVSKSLKPGKYRGTPAIPIEKYSRQEVYVRKLEEYVARLKRIEEKLKEGQGPMN